MPAKPPRVGWVTISTKDPPLTVTARLSEERPNIEQGFGGWDEIERPRRAPLTTFKGTPALHLSLSILLDAWKTGISIERQIAALERMGRPSASNGEPPHVKISSTGGAIPYQARTWLVGGLSYGDALMNRSGDRVRQQITLSLIEYVADVRLVELSAATRRRQRAAAQRKRHGAAAKRIVAKKSAKSKPKRSSTRASDDVFGTGEDLLTLAARELGDANRWVEIAALNGLRDPRAIAPGQTLRMP
jgi:hypothetical protein